MRPPVNHPFGSAYTNAKLAPFPPAFRRSCSRHTGSHGNAELTRARHQAATTTVPPAQHLRSPTAATPAAPGQPCRPIRCPRHSAVYLRSSHKKTEHGLRPMQVCSSPLPALRFIADPNPLFAILEGAARFAATVPQAQTRYYPSSFVYIPHHLTIDIPVRRSYSVM